MRTPERDEQTSANDSIERLKKEHSYYIGPQARANIGMYSPSATSGTGPD
jgi:hypothetical protein